MLSAIRSAGVSRVSARVRFWRPDFVPIAQKNTSTGLFHVVGAFCGCRETHPYRSLGQKSGGPHHQERQGIYFVRVFDTKYRAFALKAVCIDSYTVATNNYPAPPPNPDGCEYILLCILRA